ncbi:MAG: histidinol-phosphate transaminase [Spirochaetia bacterium]
MEIQIRKAVMNIPPYHAGKKKSGCIKLSSNENPFGPSPKAVEAIKAGLSSLSVYPDKNSLRLKEKLAAVHDIKPSNIIAGNGSDEIFVMTAAAFLEPGEKALTGENTFSQYNFAVTLMGGAMETVPLRDGRFDLTGLSDSVDEKTRMIFICNPNNPTGTYVNQYEFDRFIASIPPNILVIIDEAYADFADAPDFPAVPDLLRHRNVLVTRTFSKLYGLAGLRIGYGISSSEKIIDAVSRTKQPFNINILAETGALAALYDREFREKTIQNNREQKEILYDFFESLKIRFYRSQSNFICFRADQGAGYLAGAMEERGINVRPLDSFGMPEWVRLTVGTPEQNRLFINALEDSI